MLKLHLNVQLIMYISCHKCRAKTLIDFLHPSNAISNLCINPGSAQAPESSGHHVVKTLPQPLPLPISSISVPDSVLLHILLRCGELQDRPGAGW